MQAIEVKETVDRNGNHYLIAFCAAKKIRRLKDDIGRKVRYELDWPNTEETRAEYMCKQLINALGLGVDYYGTYVIGTLKNGNYVFVFTGKE